MAPRGKSTFCCQILTPIKHLLENYLLFRNDLSKNNGTELTGTELTQGGLVVCSPVSKISNSMYQTKTSLYLWNVKINSSWKRKDKVKQTTTKTSLKRSTVKIYTKQEKYMRHHSVKCVWFSCLTLFFLSFKKKSVLENTLRGSGHPLL